MKVRRDIAVIVLTIACFAAFLGGVRQATEHPVIGLLLAGLALVGLLRVSQM
jgi:hypothetical protein